MQVRPRQRWRDLRGQGSAAQVVTVDSVDGQTVQGSYTQEDAVGVIGASAWALDDFKNMTLVHDPEWPTHRVVVEARWGDPEVNRRMLLVGLPKGGRTHDLTPEGGMGPAIAWWDVVAPTEDEAVARVREALQHLSPERVNLDSIRVDESKGRER